MHGFLELTGATTLVGMFVGIGMPLYAFALFLPSIFMRCVYPRHLITSGLCLKFCLVRFIQLGGFIPIIWSLIKHRHSQRVVSRVPSNACQPSHCPSVYFRLHCHMSHQFLGGQVATERRYLYVWLLRPLLVRHHDANVDTSALSCLGGLGYIVLITSRTPALSYVAVYVSTWYAYVAYDSLGSYLSFQCHLSPKS